MRFKSLVLAQASGSTGGLTYSHNAGGMYVRQRTVPTDPNTVAQATIRAIVASLVNHWVNTLTADQRTAWNTYATNVPLNDVFGDPRERSGINHYVRSNTPRLQGAQTRIDDGPTIFDLGEFTSPTFAILAATNKVEVTFNDNDDWVSEDNAILLIWGSRPKNPTINFFKGPYKNMQGIPGSSGAPPASPVEVGIPYAFIVGQKGFLRCNVSRADGRLSTPFRYGVVAT